jgi:CubicO group peptidase (beta-lactamase class C family)
MVKKLRLLVCLLLLGKTAGIAYDFASVDSLLNANLSGLFHNKLVCMVIHGDSLVYYYHQGADSTTTGGIASATKTMSAALMLRLVQEKVISLDDSIAKFYPFASGLGKGSITLRELFAHTSGLEGSTNYNSDRNISLQVSADSILTYDSLMYAPIGTKFRYTGEDQQVAGAAAELAAGVAWDNMFKTKISDPLGLSNTTFTLTTASNPRIAGGIQSNAGDMLRFGSFVLQSGRNAAGTQAVDSALLEELWKDQTHHALQVQSPYPNHPAHNNPYNADTIYYGVGTWLDIYNPTHRYQEQISADGAWGAIIWINRCTNTAGVFMTFPPSLCAQTNPVQFEAMDLIRAQFPFTCYQGSAVTVAAHIAGPAARSAPNPVHDRLRLVSGRGLSNVSIFDLSGRKLKSAVMRPGTSEIDITDLPEGLLLIKGVDAQGHVIISDKVLKLGK